ncbi:hypothetical protein [Nitrincola iocasae]|uniref:Argininosuccinate lyase n=1 Tax=Nitrincola iocasae TaxID=2614693 RepID=A0A5J6LDM9_9GAMM|nr:hypothetical protein [Nitrincola iocasae]QEW06466.1 hypothetical protein F5I99_08060 [Nitrincola iocasae]
MKIKLILAFLLSLFISNSALAADYYVDITNNTGYTIYYIYISPEKSTSWEEDVLGDEVLPNNETRRVTITGYKSPMFDIHLIDEDDDTYTFWGVDVSKQDLVVTLDDLD